MKQLTKEELIKVEGGGFSIGLGLALAALAAFASGVVDGIIRPLNCN